MRTHIPANSIGQARHLVTFEDPGAPVPDGEGGYTQTLDPARPADLEGRASARRRRATPSGSPPAR